MRAGERQRETDIERERRVWVGQGELVERKEGEEA